MICDKRTKTKLRVPWYEVKTMTHNLADYSDNSTRSSIIPDFHLLADYLLYAIYLKSKAARKFL